MASRFWVGGTGTWDAVTTTHWAATSGGAGGQSVPGAADTVTLDGSSGGGTVTLAFGGTITIVSLTMGAFTGTFDNSVNNNNMVLNNNSATALSGSGTGTRTIKLGTATYTLSGFSPTCTFATTTNLTLLASTSTIAFSGAINRTFNGGTTGQTFGTISFVAGEVINIAGSTFTVGTLSVAAGNYVVFAFSNATTVSTALNWVGTPTAPISLATTQANLVATLNLAAGSTIQWGGIRDIQFTGSPVATNSLDQGDNLGITITPPAAAGAQFFSAGFF